MRARCESTPLLAVLALVVGGVGLAPTPATAALPRATQPSSQARETTDSSDTWEPRPEEYAQTVTRKDLAIPMSDGTVLRGDLMVPADGEGNAVDEPLPVVVTITAYNKSLIGTPAAAIRAGGDPAYLVKRGYAQLTVDARGTGSSEGRWEAFAARENQDSGEIMTWAHEQEWSNGHTAMTGPSYMGISQLWAAAARPPGLKAIFPQVPGADVYRDVVASGGQLDVGFIPLWIGLVTGTGIVPPAVTAGDPEVGDQGAAGPSVGLAHLHRAAVGQRTAGPGTGVRRRLL